MRCLQCGKAIPLFKRLSGSSEFCSDAHRKEYQREYSQLALGRLMQSQPGESQAPPVQAPRLAGVTAPAVDEQPVVNSAPAAPKPKATPVWAEKAHPAAIPSAPAHAAKPNGIPKSQSTPPTPVKKAVPLPAATQPAIAESNETQPATAMAAAIQKPAPAELQFAPAAPPEFEHAFASLAPDRPRHQSGMLLAELPQGGAIAWQNGVEIANSIARPPEHKLDLREVPRQTPRVTLDLRIVPPECLETESRPLAIPVVLIEPVEAFIWTGPHRDFAGEHASLRDFANDQFSKADFECPVLVEGLGGSAIVEPFPTVSQAQALNSAVSSPAAGSAISAIVELSRRDIQPAMLESEPPPLAESSTPIAVAEHLLQEPQPASVESEPPPFVENSTPIAVAEPLPPASQAAVVESEPAPIAESSALSAVAELAPSEPQPACVETEPPTAETNARLAASQTAMAAPTVPVPALELTPLPVACAGSAPVKAKPIPVFSPAPMGSGIVQVPQPNGLPLRPVMVLVTPVPVAAVKTDRKHRKASVLSLGSVLSAAPNLGLPELPAQTPAGPMASRMRKILAALTGAAVLGAGLFFFVGKQSNAGLKSATPALADGVAGGQWIANFAPDAKRQRRVSLLRSSMNLPAYRLDFESSIHIKALGWVYRAQDAKNFYVNKIEFQKPGQNPVYALVHFAVINGVEQPRVETPLRVAVPMGGNYKIRFEAAGNRFTTWVQGQRVEQWTDSRLSSGGAGLYGEGAEQSILHGDFAVTPLSN